MSSNNATAGGPLLLVRRDEQELADFLSTESGFVTGLLTTFEEDVFRLERYQLEFLEMKSRWRCVEKGRQAGLSLIFACETLARAHLRPSYTGIMVSYNRDDAAEKIHYARALYDALPLEFQKPIAYESRTELSFRSNAGKRSISRIVSHPAKAPRGKKGDVFLDELAHCADDREIYRGATAVVLRSRGQLTVCSTPLGRRGVFWEIAREEVRPYTAYQRLAVPWWHCSFFARDVDRAREEAPAMETEDRVRRFGTQGIQDQFDSLLLEEFQEEFEVVFADETMCFFPYELIIAAQDPDLVVVDDHSFLTECAGPLYAGYDVGRVRDSSELVILEQTSQGPKYRYARELKGMPFAEQEGLLCQLITELKLRRLRIDRTGIGHHLAENLTAAFPETVEGVTFTMGSKERMASDVKIALQKRRSGSGGLWIPADRKLTSQFHSIRKRVTAAGRTVFDVEAGADRKLVGHADRFWALALALPPQTVGAGVVPGAVITVRVLG